MASELTLGLKIDLHITAQGIREPIFAYYHDLERSSENQEGAQRGQPLVTKTFRDSGRYWVTLSFPNLPDIFCLDETHNKLRGIPLDAAINRFGAERASFTRISWRHENSITATWEGIRVLDFQKSYESLKEVLGETLPKDLSWQPFRPTPQTLKQIAEAFS